VQRNTKKMQAMRKRYELKLIPSNNAFKQKSESKNNVDSLRISKWSTKWLAALLCLQACATTPKVIIPENTKFFSGRAEVLDKKKNKTDHIRFYLATSQPDLFRIDVNYGMLNIPLGTLILRNEEAQFVNLVEGKNYHSSDGSRALERLLKTKLTPYQIIAIFSETFPLPAPWQCRGVDTKKMNCETTDLFLELQRDENKRYLKVNSERSSISMEYTVDKKRKVSFEWLSPNGFEKVTL
jgi:hypothetical protein